MENERLKGLGIVGATSRSAGVLVGTTATFGKKVVGLGVKGVTTVAGLKRSALEQRLSGWRVRRKLHLPCLSRGMRRLKMSRSRQDLSAAVVEQKSAPVAVRPEPEAVDTPVFRNAAERMIFTKALSDIVSEYPAVRADAARAIASVRHESSVKALARQMQREPLPQVRQECVKALTRLEMKEGLGAVERALTDRDASVRLAAVRGLYRLAGAESAPALVRMLCDENEGVRRRAVTCICWLGDETLAVELLPLLDDSSVLVRRSAVEAMSRLRSRQVVSSLIEHLNDPDKSMRKPILGAIQTITGKRMGGPFPRDNKSYQRLVARWHQWWREELLG